jgi:hypothetical protein
MQKYKLINTKTKEETICNKIQIENFDYYVELINNEEYPDMFTWYVDIVKNELIHEGDSDNFINPNWKTVIACNNPNIDIPQVVDEIKELSKKLYNQSYDEFNEPTWDEGKLFQRKKGFIEGYNKRKETFPFSEEDIVDFYEWCDCSEEAALFWKKNRVYPDMSGNHYKQIRENRKKLLQLWKEQQPKIIYYE